MILDFDFDSEILRHYVEEVYVFIKLMKANAVNININLIIDVQSGIKTFGSK